MLVKFNTTHWHWSRLNTGLSPIKTMGSKVENIVAKFLLKVLNLIIWGQEYDTINKIIQCLYINSSNLPTTLGIDGGRHGHISIIMKPTLWTRNSTKHPRDGDGGRACTTTWSSHGGKKSPQEPCQHGYVPQYDHNWCGWRLLPGGKMQYLHRIFERDYSTICGAPDTAIRKYHCLQN